MVGHDPTQVSREPARWNIVARHWRGSYTLGIAYWLIGILSILAIKVASSLLKSADVHSNFGLHASSAVAITFLSFVVAVIVWEGVGIWRSANLHVQRGGTRIWANVARLMVIVGLLVSAMNLTKIGLPILLESIKLLVIGDDTPPFEIRVLGDGAELELSGGMPFGTADALTMALDEAPDVDVIHLNSTGGRIGEARQIYQLIRQRQLATYTSSNCLSACTIAFLGGSSRLLGEWGRLGFHSVSIGSVSGTDLAELNTEYRQVMTDNGIPQAFIQRVERTHPDELWFPTQEELRDAGFINGVVPSKYYAPSGVKEWREVDEVDEGLLKVSLYAALKEHEPASYEKLYLTVVGGIQQRIPMAKVQQEIRQIIIGELVPEYLQIAPDESLLRYFKTHLDEMKHLESVNPQLCADFVFPEWAMRPVDLVKYLPVDLREADVAALMEIIKGGAMEPNLDVRGASEAEWGALWSGVEARYAGASLLLADPSGYRNEPDKLCSSTIAFYSEILSMPDRSTAARLLRIVARG